MIEPTYNNSYNSPCLIVPKKDSDEWRVVIDFRKINKQLMPNAETIPTISNIFRKLDGKKYFSSIDLTKCYWQLPLNKRDRKFLGFTDYRGQQWQYKRAAMGIMTTSQYCQSVMRNIFNGIPVQIYLDDILIAEDSIEKHNKVLKQVINRTIKHNIDINIINSKFGSTLKRDITE